MRCGGWMHEEHTADVLVIAYGRTLEEAFENAARGVYEVVTDTSRVEPRRRVDASIEGIDLENLLYRFIENLIAYTDSEGLVFGLFRVCKIECSGESCSIVASAWGEEFDPSRHEHRTIVKAMTYADMEIKEENGCWRVQFVVDI
ncbi:archease [Aeropyrum pernix]|nr:archease [Aeropyrum pernix]